jgi:S-methylmethionine-dependent homocysteine/selenocysteine methylase
MKSILLSSQHKSLRQWITNPPKNAQPSAHTHSDEESGMTKEQEQQQQQLPERPDILILDGGVSTHLEELHKQHSSTSSFCSTKAFQHRELWSSSLLLDQKGQHDIQTSHETFYNSGCNIISTVTYQLSHHLCKEVTKTSSNTNNNNKNNNKNNTNSTEHDDDIDNDEKASENNEKIILTE